MTTRPADLTRRFTAIPNAQVNAAFTDDDLPEAQIGNEPKRADEELQGIATMAQIAALGLSDWFWEFCDAVFPNNQVLTDKRGPGAPQHYPDWLLFMIHCAASMTGHGTVKSAVVCFRDVTTWNAFANWVDAYVPEHMTRLRDLPRHKPNKPVRPIAAAGTARNGRTQGRARIRTAMKPNTPAVVARPPQRHHLDHFTRRWRGQQKNGQPIPIGHRDYGIHTKAIEQFPKGAIDQAQAMGVLHPGARFFYRHPDRNQFVGADGVVMPTQKVKRPPEPRNNLDAHASDPGSEQGQTPMDDSRPSGATRPPRDITAALYTTGGGTKVYGSKWTIVSCRVDAQYMSRLILDMRHVHKTLPGSARDESPAVLDMLPTLRALSHGGIRGLLVDSAVRGSAVIELQREGIVVVNYPHAESNPDGGPGRRLNPARKEKSRLRLIATHTDATGAPCEHPIFAVGGELLELVSTVEGNDTTRTLPIMDYERRGATGKVREYLKVAITCAWAGNFTARVPLFHTDATTTSQTGINWGEVCRVYPPGSRSFKHLYGARNDTEARHSDLKARIKNLPPDRAGQQLRLLAAGIAINAIAWQVHLQAHGQPNILDGG